MKKNGLIWLTVLLFLADWPFIWAKDKNSSPLIITTIDSLNLRTKELQAELPRLSDNKNALLFFKRRELDMTIFLYHYHQFLYDEELDNAKTLVESRLQGAEKRKDSYSVDFYREYKSRLNTEMVKQREYYQSLFKKEKNFKKELYHYIESGDEYSLHRAKKMTQLALKYANEQNLSSVIPYLKNYEQLVEALIFDYNSVYDLKKLTSSDAVFQKVFKPMIESDSVEVIKKAGELVDHCYAYSANRLSVLDNSYFEKQKNVVKTSIQDYNERMGNNLNLSNLAGQSVIVRFDSLNKDGVYKWQDKIIVIGTIKLTAKFETVRKGEAIIDADRRLVEFIRVNRLARLGNEVKLGSTFLIPYKIDNKITNFNFNPHKKGFQYMVCYTKVQSKYFTKGISKYLPPMQFAE